MCVAKHHAGPSTNITFECTHFFCVVDLPPLIAFTAFGVRIKAQIVGLGARDFDIIIVNLDAPEPGYLLNQYPKQTAFGRYADIYKQLAR